MFFLAWTRKIYRTLSSDASPNAIAFAIAFGLTLGFVPFFSGLGLALGVCILIFRVQLSAAILALSMSKGLYAIGLWKLLIPVGIALLEPAPVQEFWTWCLNLPVVALLDLDRLAVTGGAVIGIGLGTLLFWPVQRTVIAYRTFIHKAVTRNRVFNWITSWWLIKLLRFVFIGTKMTS